MGNYYSRKKPILKESLNAELMLCGVCKRLTENKRMVMNPPRYAWSSAIDLRFDFCKICGSLKRDFIIK